MKIIRNIAACALASSALVGSGLGLAAMAAGSAAPAAVVTVNAGSTPCPYATHYEYGQCVPD